MQTQEYLIHLLKSFGVHIFFAIILALSFNFPVHQEKKEQPKVSALDAVVIDQVSLDKQVNKIKKQKADAKAAEEKRVKDLEKRAEQAKNKLNTLNKQKSKSERDAQNAKKKALAEKKKAQAEKVKADNAKKERIKREKEAAKAKQDALAAKKQKEAEQKAADKAKKDALAAKKQKEAEQKALKEAEALRLKQEKEAKLKKEREEREAAEQAIREKMMQEQLAQEQSVRNQARQKYVVTEKEKYTALIMGRIQQYLIVDDSMKGQSCNLNIKLAFSGLVTSVTVLSGDDKVCKAAERAVLKAETLPVSKESDVYQELKDISLTVEPKF